ncbi:TRAP transporter permease [Oceanobacter kriegii]|uniref:TRAP transporter permease n=1 Tax=Oceanobacter kriegii TaxID=64972 RepID=UPI001B7FAA05|nr:TRAP transporter fused permease subunit [Oceanobacter kriegii]
MSISTSLGVALLSTGDRRKPEGYLGKFIAIYGFMIALWVLWSTIFSTSDVLMLTIVYLTQMLVLVFLVFSSGHVNASDKPTIMDYTLSLLSFGSSVFFLVNMDSLADRISLLTPLTDMEFGVGVVVSLVTLEATRRTVGLGLTLIAGAFIVYNLFGHLIDGEFGHGYISLADFIDINIYTSDGLFGVPVRVAATYAFLFVMFGTFLEAVKGGDFFFRLASRLTGRSVGGPAKVAIISSGLFGTVSGSPTADVVTTGSVTIPLMRRLGFSKDLASGIEVSASTGGSLLPPIMGSVAFIMAEYTGLAYNEIIIASLIPAILYYIGVYVQVHLYCLAHGVANPDGDEIPGWKEVFEGSWMFLVPFMAMVIPLVAGYSPTFVAVFGIAAIMVVSQVPGKCRVPVKTLMQSFPTATIRMVGVTAACASAGLVIGGITMTGLGTKFSSLILMLAGDSQLMTLVLSAIVTIILGMGMPTPSAYILAAVLVGPTLVNHMDLPIMSAHLFILYYAVLSAMTPPVAVAAYAAAGLCHGNPITIAVTAVRLSVIAFVFPFSFIYNPGVLLEGSLIECVFAIIQALFATVFIAIAAEGYFSFRINNPIRLVILCCGLSLLAPGHIYSIIPVILVVALLAAIKKDKAGLLVKPV